MALADKVEIKYVISRLDATSGRPWNVYCARAECSFGPLHTAPSPLGPPGRAIHRNTSPASGIATSPASSSPELPRAWLPLAAI